MQKILVIDDDEFFHHIFNVIFREKYLIDSATSAEKVYEYIFDVHYDLIVVDISLNHRDLGKVIIREIRKLSAYAEVPIICCSANSSDIKKKEVFEAGADYYLEKPVSSSGLKNVVEFFLFGERDIAKVKVVNLNLQRI